MVKEEDEEETLIYNTVMHAADNAQECMTKVSKAVGGLSDAGLKTQLVIHVKTYLRRYPMLANIMEFCTL